MWKIKDPDAVKALIKQLLSDDEIAKRCSDQMDDGSSYILLYNDDENIQLKLEKERFENVPEYNPEGWNPFPAIRPPRAGNYLVYMTENFENRIRASYYYNDYRGWDIYQNSSVMAFKEFEVEAPGDDVLKFSKREQ